MLVKWKVVNPKALEHKVSIQTECECGHIQGWSEVWTVDLKVLIQHYVRCDSCNKQEWKPMPMIEAAIVLNHRLTMEEIAREQLGEPTL